MALPFLRRDPLSQNSVRHTQETEVSIAHSRIPGRIRFRIPTLQRAPHLAHRLERLVAGLSKVRDASATPLTGALLVHYTQSMEIQELHRRIGQLLEELTGSGAPATDSKGIHVACPANPQPLGSHEQGPASGARSRLASAHHPRDQPSPGNLEDSGPSPDSC